MHYVRVFPQQSDFQNWSVDNPKLPRLLKCFEIERNAPNPKPPSIFAAHDSREELEAVAALFQNDPGTPEKRFAVRITQADCDTAGVTINTMPGNTGIIFVDRRHSDLCGSPTQYRNLIRTIVEAIWRGEDRLRVFTPQQILGQIAIFSKIGQPFVEPEAQKRCEDMLKGGTGSFSCTIHDGSIILDGKFDDKEDIRIRSQRPITIPTGSESAPYPSQPANVHRGSWFSRLLVRLTQRFRG
jgi:hypothetical protein